MEFSNLRILEIRSVLHYFPDIKSWTTRNRTTHIVGIQQAGRAVHRFPDRTLVLTENTVFFFNQAEDYAVTLEDEQDFSFSVHFTTAEPVDTPSFCRKITRPDDVVSLLTQLDRRFARRPNGDLAAMGLLYQLCDRIAQCAAAPYQAESARLAGPRDYMDLHFSEADCLHQAAALSGVTSRRFCDLFKAEFRTTPQQYLIEKRINAAKQLLATGGVSVTRTAELCGFSDVYYFSRAFKGAVGCPPSDFAALRDENHPK